MEALERGFPTIERDYASLELHQCWESDGRKADVFCVWPDGVVNRPFVIAIRDVRTRKVLSIRICHAPDTEAVLGAYGAALMNTRAVPAYFKLDNGREYANKAFTGHQKTRYRNKYKADEAVGILTAMNVKVHWSKPGQGRDKPIESWWNGGDSTHQAERCDSGMQVPQSKGVVTVLSAEESRLYELSMSKSALVIADIIGMSLTVKLVANCGGNLLQPTGKDLAFLRDILGDEAASKLKAWTGSQPIMVPLCESARKAVVHSRIRAEFDRLTTVENLSSRRAVRNLTFLTSPPMHERTIQRILKQVDRAPIEERASEDRWDGQKRRLVAHERPEAIWPNTDPALPISQFLFSLKGGGKGVVRVEDIAWIEAVNNGAVLHTAEAQPVLRGHFLSNLLPRMGPWFVRCNGGAAVRLSWIKRLTAADKSGVSELVLRDGTRLRCSAKYRTSISSQMKRALAG